MSDESDWRLQGQERYLRGVTLIRCTYSSPAENPTWDHDRCEFCGAKLIAEDRPGVLREGYATEDGYRWFCTTCFEDVKDRFAWRVVPQREALDDA